MKKLAFILLFMPMLLQAAITSYQATYVAATEKDPECYSVNVNNSDGTHKNVMIKGDDIKDSKVSAVMNESSFELPRPAYRFIMYYNDDGTPNYIDCSMKDPFATQQVYKWDDQATEDISTLKDYLEKH